jgi:hypothetical protein
MRLTAHPMEKLAQLTAEEKLTKHFIVVEVLKKTVCFILDNPIGQELLELIGRNTKMIVLNNLKHHETYNSHKSPT